MDQQLPTAKIQGRAPYASDPAYSRGRLYVEPESETRTVFQRDRDRIIHSGAFRKLQYKTQVFVYHEGDYYRTRLTHSIEVAQIARSIARVLHVDEDLAEAVALAHDLGHTPFGHAGEHALDACMADYGGFDHNDQALRIVTRLEERYADFNGLNLSWEALDGLVKHNGPLLPLPKGAFLPITINAFRNAFDLELETYAGVEAQVAALSDDIAYNTHDIEDGVRAGFFTLDELSELPLVGDIIQEVRGRNPGLDSGRVVHETTRRLIDRLVRDLTAETGRRLADIEPRSADDVRKAGKPTVALSDAIRTAEKQLRHFLDARMYHDYRVNRMTSKARRILADLFKQFIAEPDTLPTQWQAQIAQNADRTAQARVIADYLAGMTDRFAIAEHQRFFDFRDPETMNIYHHFLAVVQAALADIATAGGLPAGLDTSRVVVEAPRDVTHGDLATNAAMVLSKPAGMKPRDLAELLAPKLTAHHEVRGAEIAGPGFINLRLTEGFWRDRLKDVLIAGDAYGESDEGRGKRVNVEYVSANPTGPLTAGHARGAVVGDAIASLLAKTGHEVCREYYINDAGAQVDVLARSAFLRYREALGEVIAEIPAGFYPGEYLKAVGQALAERDGAKWRDLPEAEWLPELRAFAVARMMAAIEDDLGLLGIHMDRFSSERALVEAGAVKRALTELDSRGLLYTGLLEPPKGKQPEDWEPREQLLFRSTRFGDDVDRPLAKADGSYTYFANDIAYHFDKFSRGYPTLIDIVGADHGGWVKRITAAVVALTDGKAAIDIKLCQLVNLLQDGQPVKMSKRSGTFVTLRDIIDEVGRGVVRFIMLTRRNDQTLDFDFAKVMDQSKDNPVYYVQYAHARCRSVLRLAEKQYGPAIVSSESLLAADIDQLDSPEELDMIRRMAAWPAVISGAADAHEPHRIAFYLYDLAASFQQLYARGSTNATLRFLLDNDRSMTIARLALVRSVATVIAGGLRLIGVEPAEELRS